MSILMRVVSAIAPKPSCTEATVLLWKWVCMPVELTVRLSGCADPASTSLRMTLPDGRVRPVERIASRR
ncbi:hypothetical protein [Nonomuraea sp. NPDC050202]|uniref:hypothetical protein n=1 Tax=Nonomuraea sp. NPDC050202 TaxID=3155035 RepID=UPI0033C12E34